MSWNKRPPIEGMPKERPRCGFCDKLIRPLVNDERERQEFPISEQLPFAVATSQIHYVSVRRTFVRWDGYGSFCTLRCAEAFANAAYRAGYRITRRDA